MIKKLIYIFSILYIQSVFSQENSVCNLNDSDINIAYCLISSGGSESVDIISEISNKAGIYPNFVFKNCSNIYNAAAIINTYDKKRYILFDKQYFLDNLKINKWEAIFILAHEIGHHLNGHTLKASISYIESQQRELEADAFAGYILYRLGATEHDLINVFNKFPDVDSEYSTHPKNEKRIAYALKGYNNEKRDYMHKLSKDKIRFEKEFTKNKNEQIKNDLYKYFFLYLINNKKEYLDRIMYLIEKTDQSTYDIDWIIAEINKNLGNYELAKERSLKSYLKKRDNLNAITYMGLFINTETIVPTHILDNIANFADEINDANLTYSLAIYYFIVENNIEKSYSYIKKTYELVRNKDDDFQYKSDMYFYYGYISGKNEALGNKRYGKAIFYITKAKEIIEKLPDNEYHNNYRNQILYRLAQFQLFDKRYLEALSTFTEFLERDNIEAKHWISYAHDYIADIYFLFGENMKSIEHVTIAINQCENIEMKAFFYYKRGKIYHALKEESLALRDFKESCRLGFKSDACN